MTKSRSFESFAGFIILFLFVFAGWRLYREHFVFRGEDEEIVIATLVNNASHIRNACEKLDMNPRLLAGVIYAERRVNVNLLDSFERAYASLGNNTSIGLAQIRINNIGG